jgi:hypothetical protein
MVGCLNIWFSIVESKGSFPCCEILYLWPTFLRVKYYWYNYIHNHTYVSWMHRWGSCKLHYLKWTIIEVGLSSLWCRIFTIIQCHKKGLIYVKVTHETFQQWGKSTLRPPKIVVTNITFMHLVFLCKYKHHILDFSLSPYPLWQVQSSPHELIIPLLIQTIN